MGKAPPSSEVSGTENVLLSKSKKHRLNFFLAVLLNQGLSLNGEEPQTQFRIF